MSTGTEPTGNTGPPTARLITRSVSLSTRDELYCAEYSVVQDRAVTVGREGEIPIGTVPSDKGISRQALTVTFTTEGITLSISNRNRVVLHLWGQQLAWLDAGHTFSYVWPRIGVRLIGSNSDVHHWVLLEADSLGFIRPLETNSRGTELHQTPRALTPSQMQAVRGCFAQHLAWPPVEAAAVATPLSAVASRCGVAPTTISQRLHGVRQRAYAIGLAHQAGVMDPSYLYPLVRLGLFDLPVPFKPAK